MATPEGSLARRANPALKVARSRHRLVLASGILLLCIAIGLALYFGRSPGSQVQPEAEPHLAGTPARQLHGLGYLPAECNLVFAVQLAPVLEYAARTNEEPRNLLTRDGVPEQVFTTLEAIGIQLAQIDHIVGGVHLPDPGEGDFRAALVLVLKQPLANEVEFRKRLKAKPGMGKPRYDSVEVGKLPLQMACISPTVWVFGFSAGDFSAVEKGGFGPGGTQFSGARGDRLQQMLAAIPPEAAVWLAADDASDWTQKPLLKLAAQSHTAKMWLASAKHGRGGMFAVGVGERPRLRLVVRTVDSATAGRLMAYFQGRAAETESALASGEGDLCQYDGPFDRMAIERFLADLSR